MINKLPGIKVKRYYEVVQKDNAGSFRFAEAGGGVCGCIVGTEGA